MKFIDRSAYAALQFFGFHVICDLPFIRYNLFITFLGKVFCKSV